MIPYDDNIVEVIDIAYRTGYNIPKYFFQREYDEIKDTLVDREVYFNSPMIFLKPSGIDFTYILFWNGYKFRGGFVSINNNYCSVQRGHIARNGETLFASHVPEIKRNYKKITSSEPRWIAKSFILSPEGKLYYWGEDDVAHYRQNIELLTGRSMDELVEEFIEERNSYRPEGFVATLPVKSVGSNEVLYYQNHNKSISKSWKCLYSMLNTMPNSKYFTTNVDGYMRLGFAQLNMHRKIT